MSQPATRRFRRQCQGTRCRLALAVEVAVAVLALVGSACVGALPGLQPACTCFRR